jgi:hypothetical protein
MSTNTNEIRRIWGSHGGEYEDGVGKLLRDYTVLQPRKQPSSQMKFARQL